MLGRRWGGGGCRLGIYRGVTRKWKGEDYLVSLLT